MVADSVRQLLAAAKKQGCDTNIPAVAVTATLLPGFDPDHDDTMFSPAVLLAPSPHPLLEAFMEVAGANRRGRMSWAVGLGEDYNPAPLQVVVSRLLPGTVFPDRQTYTTKASRKLTEVQNYHKRRDLEEMMRGTRANITAQAMQTVIERPYPKTGSGRFGAVTLSTDDQGRILWIKVITTDELNPPEDEGLPQIPLNLRRAGRPFVDPRPHRPADAVAVLDWLASEGVTIVDPDPTNPIARLRARVSKSIIAVPAPGRPALADVSVGRKVLREKAAARFALDPIQPAQAATRGRMAALDVIAALRAMPAASGVIHPGTADIGVMAHAAPVTDDPRLRDYQTEAVGLHLATDIGYLLCAAPGMGKTVIQYGGMARRAANIDRYRALVVCEPNVRAQWVSEADTWFPDARVLAVESRADSARIAEAVQTDDGPLVVVMSYALLATVTDELNSRAAEADGDASNEEAGEQELASRLAAVETPQPAAAQEQAVVETAAAVPTEYVVQQGEDFFGQLDLFSLFAEPSTPPAPAVAEADAAGEDEPEDVVCDGQEPLWPSLGALLLDTYWHDIAADEAEVLRGTGSKQAAAMWELRSRAGVAVALTGTPINRGVDDLGRLISWVRGDQFLFHGVRLSTQFDLNDDDELAEFWSAMGPLVFRRDSSEIEDELPTITPTVMLLKPTPEEKALTNAAQRELKRVYTELLAWLDMVEQTDPDNPQYAQAREGLKAARGAWLGGTTLARMASSDPAALLGSTSAGAALLAGQGLIEAANENPGTKRTAVVTAVSDRVANGHRVLIFTEFATVARGIIDDLDACGVRVGEVLGGGGRKRDRMIAQFQCGELDVLVCTSSGERGLNLQQASVIVHYDLPWTPKAVIQRTGRAMRIGSENQHVEVMFPLMEGTIEERVAGLVVSRAVEAMRALDASRGVDTSRTEMGLALGGLTVALEDIEGQNEGSALMQMTRALVA